MLERLMKDDDNNDDDDDDVGTTVHKYLGWAHWDYNVIHKFNIYENPYPIEWFVACIFDERRQLSIDKHLQCMCLAAIELISIFTIPFA